MEAQDKDTQIKKRGNEFQGHCFLEALSTFILLLSTRLGFTSLEPLKVGISMSINMTSWRLQLHYAMGELSPQEVPQVRCVLRIDPSGLFAFKVQNLAIPSAIWHRLCSWLLLPLPVTAPNNPHNGLGECALPSSSPFCLTYEPGGIHFWGLLVIKYQRLGSSHNIILFSHSPGAWKSKIKL